MARAMTTPEQTLMRTAGQRSKLRLAIYNPATIYAARVNQTITTTDQVKEIIYDGGSGTLANVLPDMTLMVGSGPGLGDKGVLRIRKAPSATVIYFNETSEVAWADNDYLTVLNEFLPAARPVAPLGESLLIDSEITYAGQHYFCQPVPIMGPAVAVLELTGASVSHTRSPGASYCPGSTISTYAWAATGPASVTITNGTTVSPTFAFTAVGWYRLALTVTAANTVSRTGYRWVYVWDAAHPLIEYSGPAPTGSQDAGGWEFSITKASQADLTYIGDRAMVVVVAEDWYGSTKQSIGPLSGFENVVAIGWISGETIEWDPRKGSVKFTVKGPHYWLSQINAQPVTLKNIIDTIPTEWDQFHDLTVDLALWHVCAWRSTITTCMDVFLSGDTALVPIISGTGSSLWDALRTIAKKIGALPLCDRYGRLIIEVDTQVLPVADRAAIPVVMDVGKVDWKDSIQIARRLTRVVSTLDLSAQSYDGTTISQILARAPGNSGAQYGRTETSDGWIVPTQARANELAGLLFAQRNSAYPVEPISIAANNRLVDICPRQVVTQSLATGDTLRGLSWSTRRLIPRRVEFVISAKTGRMHTEIEAETETSGIDGITVLPPAMPQPNWRGGGTGTQPQPAFPMPKFGWGPTPIPEPPVKPPPVTPTTPAGQNCLTDAPANGPWDTWLRGTYTNDMPLNYGTLPCILRAAGVAHQSRYEIRGKFYERANLASPWVETLDDTFYSLHGVNADGTRLATGIKNSVVAPGRLRSGTFGPLAATEVAAIELALGNGDDINMGEEPDGSIETPQCGLGGSGSIYYYALTNVITSPTLYSVANATIICGGCGDTIYHNAFIRTFPDATLAYNVRLKATVIGVAKMRYLSFYWYPYENYGHPEYLIGTTQTDVSTYEASATVQPSQAFLGFRVNLRWDPNQTVVWRWDLWVEPIATRRMDIESLVLYDVCPAG